VSLGVVVPKSASMYPTTGTPTGTSAMISATIVGPTVAAVAFPFWSIPRKPTKFETVATKE
jgi:hypothetical protein